MSKLNLLTISIILNLVLLVTQLTLSLSRSFQGQQVSGAEEKLSQVQAESRQIHLQIYYHSALSQLETRARDLRMGPVQSVSWPSLPVAFLP